VPPVDYLRHPTLLSAALRPRRTVLLLSHMRSYSSLISHILGSSPEIDGYVEVQRKYTSPRDLRSLRIAVAKMEDNRLQGRYVLDKVLHNKWKISNSVLHDPSVWTLFSVREPEATIKSTVAMALSGSNPDRNWKTDLGKVGTYYVRRCEGLVRYAERKPTRSAFFVAERLIDRSDETLTMLSDFLELRTPLTSTYEKKTNTRRRGFGDPSENIAAGEIKRDRKQHDVVVPDDILAECTAAYTTTVGRLIELCDVSLPGDRP
jgi:hypothetical protein